MATRKKVESKAVAVVQSKAVTVGGWRERAAKSVAVGKATSAKLPQQSGSFLSFRGGALTLGGQTQPNPMPLVLLSYSFERSYYSQQYQPDVMATPDCYSYDGETPHEKAKVPQSDRCATCRFNEFGSSQNGKGKGCKEGAKFAAFHADYLDSPERIAAAPIVQGRLSVLNSKGFRNYVGYFEDSSTPIWAGVSTLEVRPDSKSQYAVTFSNSVAELDDADLDAIAVRVDEADKLLSQPYPDLEEAPKPTGKAALPARKRKF